MSKDYDDDKRIIPDGGSVRVSVMAMDGTQREISGQVLDQRVLDNRASNQATLDRMQHDADKAQAWADHFTAKRDATADRSSYGTYCRELSDAWRRVAA